MNSCSLAAIFAQRESENHNFVSCSLKRKRPPKIEIPNVLREISSDIFKKIEVQLDGPVCFDDSKVGVFSMKGKKKFMEDAHKIYSNGKKGFFGVYDGHGGSKAAEFVAENLHLQILEMLENVSENKVKEEAVKAGYLKTDEEFLKQSLGSGACCVTALIEGHEMIISNLGDCRAVLCKNGIAEAITTDHRPTREDERRRIEEKGGYVENHRGTWRVHGTLAVSRSIGDALLKDWVTAEPDTTIIDLTPEMEYVILASDGLWEEVGNQEAVDIVMKSCSVGKKQPPQLMIKSPTISSAKSRRIFHRICQKKSSVHLKTSEHDENEIFCENESPPSKSQRISLANQMKINTPFSNDENQESVDKKVDCGGLLAACKELVDLAVFRGSLDDITVMIVDLKQYNDDSFANMSN